MEAIIRILVLTVSTSYFNSQSVRGLKTNDYCESIANNFQPIFDNACLNSENFVVSYYSLPCLVSQSSEKKLFLRQLVFKNKLLSTDQSNDSQRFVQPVVLVLAAIKVLNLGNK